SALRPIRPLNANIGVVWLAEAEMEPAELPAGVPAPDGDLPLDDPIVGADLHPGADRVAVRPRLGQTKRDPIAHGRGSIRAPGANVSPDPGRRPVIDLHEVQQTIQVEVGKR